MIGQDFQRLDGPAKVTGQARYLDDIPIANCWYGVTIRSSVPHAKLIGIDRDPDFDWSNITFVTADDIPGENCVFLNTPDQPVLVKDEIRHVAEPVALLAAPSRELALEARKHVTLRYEECEALLDFEQSKGNQIKIFGDNNVFAKAEIRHGDIDAAFANAECIIEGDYYTSHQEQLYLEPQGICAKPREDGGITIFGSMQCPYYIQNALGRILGHERFNVVQTTTGGAFGGKEEYPSILSAHAALLCMKSGQTVKMIYRRDEDLLATTKRHPCKAHYKTAVDPKTGKLLAIDVSLLFDAGAYNTLSPVVNSRGVLHAAGPYYCPNVHIIGEMVATHTPPNGAFRGFGAPQSLFAIERHLDRIARELHFDPIELRNINLFHQGQETPTGQVLKAPLAEAVWKSALDFAAEHPKDSDDFDCNADDTPRRLARGRGMVVGWHGAGFTGNGESIFKAKSDVELNGRDVYIFTGSIDMGQGLDSVFPAIVADTLGLPIERVHMGPHDTAQVPNSGPTAASRSTMVVGAVVKKAAENLIEALKAEIGASDGETFAQMVDRRQNTAPLRVRAQYPGDSAVWDRDLYRGDAYPDYAWISVLVDLDVDLDTGEILFRRLFQSADAGVCLNPQSVRGQFEGGALQALGWSHSEHVIVGQNGAMRNNHLTDYIIPTSLDAPDMSVDLKNIPFESGPFGAKGMGEMPHDCPAAAVAQAIEDATGIVLDELPMNPEAIVAKLLARSEKE